MATTETAERLVYACTSCGYLWAVPVPWCQFCQEPVTEVPPPPVVRPAPAVKPTLRLVGFSPIAGVDSAHG